MIAYDNSAKAQNTSVTSTTISNYVLGSSSSLLVVVTANGANDNSTGVTFNGNAMTNLYNNAGNGFDIWYTLGASGTHDIVSTKAGTNSMNVLALSFTGVLQTGFPDAQAQSASVTNVATGAWAVTGHATFSASTDALTNNTNRQSSTASAPYFQCCIGDSNAIVSGSTTFTYSQAVGGAAVYSFTIAPAPTASGNVLMFFA